MLCFWSSDNFLQTGSQVELSHNLAVQQEIFPAHGDPSSTVRRGEKLRLISLDEVAKCFPVEAEINLSCYMENTGFDCS